MSSAGTGMSDVEDGRLIAFPKSRAKPFLSAAAGGRKQDITFAPLRPSTLNIVSIECNCLVLAWPLAGTLALTGSVGSRERGKIKHVYVIKYVIKVRGLYHKPAKHKGALPT